MAPLTGSTTTRCAAPEHSSWNAAGSVMPLQPVIGAGPSGFHIAGAVTNDELCSPTSSLFSCVPEDPPLISLHAHKNMQIVRPKFVLIEVITFFAAFPALPKLPLSDRTKQPVRNARLTQSACRPARAFEAPSREGRSQLDSLATLDTLPSGRDASL